jgi:hypothetical protein
MAAHHPEMLVDSASLQRRNSSPIVALLDHTQIGKSPVKSNLKKSQG